MAGIAAVSYADALFSIALEEHKLEEYKEQLCFVNEQLQENKQFLSILTHPKIHKQEKKQAFCAVFEQCVDHMMLNFFQLLIDKSRFQDIADITKEFIRRYHIEKDIVLVYGTSAKALSEEEQKRLIDMLEKKLQKQVDLHLKTDPSLLAGIRIKVNDVVLDATALNRIEKLKQLAKQQSIGSESECEGK